MKRFPTILAAGINKARKHPLALLVTVALLVTAADLALVAAHRVREAALRARLADAHRPFQLDAASASAADRLFPDESGRQPMSIGGWGLRLPGWLSFCLPHGADEGSPADLSEHLPGLAGR